MATRLIQGSALSIDCPDGSVHMACTSPPYYSQRDYGGEPIDWPEVSYSPMPGVAPITIPAMRAKLGLERSPEAFVGHLVLVFREVRRVLRDDGTCWINLGDSYSASTKGRRNAGNGNRGNRAAGKAQDGMERPASSLPAKSVLFIPWRVGLALQADGWLMRTDVIADFVWEKPNVMPESVKDRPSRNHEYVLFMAKGPRYYYDREATSQKAINGGKTVKLGAKDFAKRQAAGMGIEPSGNGKADSYLVPDTKNLRSVWSISTQPNPEAHFATWPEGLVRPMVLAGTSKKGVCPACGAQYVRVIHRDRVPTRPGKDTKTEGKESIEKGNRDPLRHVTKVKTVGWKAGCDCKAGKPIPATVLDPFVGSGTTPKVCELLGRDCIGVDLNPEYLQIAGAKVEQGQRPHKPRGKRRPEPEEGVQRDPLIGQQSFLGSVETL